VSATGLTRTQYWNVDGNNRTPRTGATSRAESRVDVENHLLPAESARNAALYTWGVAEGFEVSAAVGSTGINVAPGTALDTDGHLIVLGIGGTAIVDPTVPPTGVQNIPTVPVTPTGVALDTTGFTGEHLVTVTWREVEETPSNLIVLNQAPWLRLAAVDTFIEDGRQLVLAAVTLGTGGAVTSLTLGPRRLAGVVAGRVQLNLPAAAPGGVQSAQRVAAQVVPASDGGVELSIVNPAGVVRRALSVAGGNGDLQLDAGLKVAHAAALAAGLTVAGSTEVGGDDSAAGNLSAGGDLVVVGDAILESKLNVGGNVQANSATLAALTVTGAAVLNGATQVTGAVQLTNSVTVSGLTTLANTNIRNNATVGAGSDGILHSRHVKGKSNTSDATGALHLNWDNQQPVHVGNSTQQANLFVSGRLGVKTTSPSFELQVAGTICANVFCNPSDLRLKDDVTDIDGVLDRLADVRAVTFTRRDAEPQTPARRQAGVLAQDMVRAFPELVVTMDADGMMGVDYAGLAGVLVGAVNELREANAALAARVAELDRRGTGE